MPASRRRASRISPIRSRMRPKASKPRCASSSATSRRPSSRLPPWRNEGENGLANLPAIDDLKGSRQRERPLGFLKQSFRIADAAFRHFIADDGWAIASHIALSTLMALFPFLIVVTALAAFFFGSRDLADEAAKLLLEA